MSRFYEEEYIDDILNVRHGEDEDFSPLDAKSLSIRLRNTMAEKELLIMERNLLREGVCV